jgi:hypothetical protein
MKRTARSRRAPSSSSVAPVVVVVDEEEAISTFALNGLVLKSTKENIAASINSAVALNATRTIYDRVGEFAWVLVLLVGLGFAGGLTYAARVSKRR